MSELVERANHQHGYLLLLGAPWRGVIGADGFADDPAWPAMPLVRR